MAVHAEYLAHAFHRDSRAQLRPPPLDDATTTTAPVFLIGAHSGGHLLAGAGQPQQAAAGHSELTCNNNTHRHSDYDVACFVPRKRARIGGAVGAGLAMEMEGHRALLPVTLAQEDVQSSGVLCSGAAPVSQLYRHSVEIDAFVRLENERLRAGLEEARRRHVRAVVSAVECAAARRLRAAEAGLERALARNAELGERLRQAGAEGQAWQGIASGHEAAAAGLRATLEQLLQTPCAGVGAAEEGQGEAAAEDARSCCFEPGQRGREAGGTRACRACGAAGACVLLLPCRHLCLCAGCGAAADTCPVCAATKNASLHVLLS